MSETSNTHPPAALWRRVAAMIYDSLLVAAIWIMVAFVCLWLFGVENAQSVEAGKVEQDPLFRAVLFSAMLLSCLIFFAVFWMKSGQTLGMQAWHIQVQSRGGGALSLGQCLLRFLGACLSLGCFGLGYFWMLFDTDKETWQDKISGSRVVLIK